MATMRAQYAGNTDQRWSFDMHLGWSASYLVTDWLPWITFIMERAMFCFYWNRHSGFRIAFPACNVSTKATIHGLTECFNHSHCSPNSSASDQGIQLIAKEVQQWVHVNWVQVHWLYCFLPPWRGCFCRMVEWLFADSVTVSTRWQYWAGERFLRSLYALIWPPKYDAVSPKARIHRSSN